MARPALTAFPRLSLYDLHCLRVETPARPVHIGILAVVDGRPLLDAAGRLRLAEIRADIDGRIARVPALRRVMFSPGPLAGRPLWVDDPAFRIEKHVTEIEVPPPGDEPTLLGVVERLLAQPLDRSRPLWRMWLMTGLQGGRVGGLVAIHHALADGLTAMRLILALLDDRRADRLGAPAASAAISRPTWGALVRDNIDGTLSSALSIARPATWRSARRVLWSTWQAAVMAGRTAPSSLNAPVGPRRRLAMLRLEASAARRVARANGCGANDVVLDVIAGGVRALLEGRGEPVRRLRPRVGIAVARFSATHEDQAGNDIGTVLLPLPLAQSDPRLRLGSIARERGRAKLGPMVAAEPTVRAWLGRWALYRRALEHQRLVNLEETYIPGPTVPVKVCGARVLELIPLAPLAGNLGLSFVALSYAGRLGITVRADADRFPDLPVLVEAMERDWQVLAATRPERRPAA